MMTPILSIIIVTYNHSNEIIECLEAIDKNYSVHPLEIFVVDNSSKDSTISVIEHFIQSKQNQNRTINLIQNVVNVGFTQAVNQGLNQATGKFLLLLNPDTKVEEKAVDSMMQFLSNHPGVGAVAPQLLFSDGSIQPSCRRFPRYRFVAYELLGLSYFFPNNKIFNGWKMGDFDHNAIRVVQQPQGSCLMIPGEVIREVGELDERFFLFFSDVDLCKRIWRNDHKIYFYPHAKVTHQKGSSIYRARAKLTWQSHLDFIRYFLKWYRLPWLWILNIFGVPFLLVLGGLRWMFYRLND
ncbi:glycosyltransferase family 2 protein [candidate division KSB1 bacterium]|nr:glycosyltransferase family 2 protein [candidate division KSB1 bacterium]